MNTLMAFVLHDKRMIGISTGPTKPPIQMGGSKFLKEEVKYRTGLRSWKSYLFWLLAIISFFVFLYLLDLFA
jgi:hypothetical protein